MTREEATKRLRGILTEAVEFENSVCYVTEEDREPLEMAIKALEQEPKWIPIEWKPFGENGYPKPEDEYKHFLTVDNKGEITIQEFLLSLDEEPQPYFTGMRNIVAWMPLPQPYKAEMGGESE